MKTDIKIAQSVGLTYCGCSKKGWYWLRGLGAVWKVQGQAQFWPLIAENPVRQADFGDGNQSTPAGEGKSTITIGLADALYKIGKKTMIAIRRPSLGWVSKESAAGGGHAQVLPMEDINLHFTGDMHAITTANNALSALIDNRIREMSWVSTNVMKYLETGCGPEWPGLRHVTIGLGSPVTVFHAKMVFDMQWPEIMAILCPAADIERFEKALSCVVIFEPRQSTFVILKEVEGLWLWSWKRCD